MFPLAAGDIEDLTRQCRWNVVKTGVGCDNRRHRVEGNAMAVFGSISFDAAPERVFPADDVTLEYSVLFPSFFKPADGLLPGLAFGALSARVGWHDTTARAHVLGDAYAVPTPGPLRFAPNGWNRVALRVKLNAVGAADGLVSLTLDGRKSFQDRLVLRTDPSVRVTAARIETSFASGGDRVVLFKDFSLSLRTERSLGAPGHRGHEPVAPEPVERVDDDVDDGEEEAERAEQHAVSVALVCDARDPEVEDDVEEDEDET